MSSNSTDNWDTVKLESISVLPQAVVTYINKVEKLPHNESYLINALHKLQEAMGYLGTAQLEAVSQLMQIPSAKVVGVASFYHYFRLKETGKFIIRICMGTACYVKGASPVVNALKEILKIDVGETTPDKLFTLDASRCLGVCSLAPVLMINEEVHAHVKPELIPALIEEYRTRIK